MALLTLPLRHLGVKRRKRIFRRKRRPTGLGCRHVAAKPIDVYVRRNARRKGRYILTSRAERNPFASADVKHVVLLVFTDQGPAN